MCFVPLLLGSLTTHLFRDGGPSYSKQRHLQHFASNILALISFVLLMLRRSTQKKSLNALSHPLKLPDNIDVAVRDTE